MERYTYLGRHAYGPFVNSTISWFLIEQCQVVYLDDDMLVFAFHFVF